MQVVPEGRIRRWARGVKTSAVSIRASDCMPGSTHPAFDVQGSNGQQLAVYRAPRGSRTEASLSLLANLSTPYAAADE